MSLIRFAFFKYLNEFLPLICIWDYVVRVEYVDIDECWLFYSWVLGLLYFVYVHYSA